MPAYVIADLEVTDTTGFEEYRRQVATTVEAYGGRYLVRGGAVDSLEGDWLPKRIVILEFDSAEQARRWYDSEDYHPLRELRSRSARSNLILADGV